MLAMGIHILPNGPSNRASPAYIPPIIVPALSQETAKQNKLFSISHRMSEWNVRSTIRIKVWTLLTTTSKSNGGYKHA